MLERRRNYKKMFTAFIRKTYGLTLSATNDVDLDKIVRALQKRYRHLKVLRGTGTNHQRLSIRTSRHKLEKLIKCLPDNVWASHHDVNEQY